jgi:hypothetical protein
MQARIFPTWCRQNSMVQLPASPATVVAFITTAIDMPGHAIDAGS